MLGCTGSAVGARGLSNCSSQSLGHRLDSYSTEAYLLRGMWNLPGSGTEPTSPALTEQIYH